MGDNVLSGNLDRVSGRNPVTPVEAGWRLQDTVTSRILLPTICFNEMHRIRIVILPFLGLRFSFRLSLGF